jgi:hypothetical protein
VGIDRNHTNGVGAYGRTDRGFLQELLVGAAVKGACHLMRSVSALSTMLPILWRAMKMSNLCAPACPMDGALLAGFVVGDTKGGCRWGGVE